MKKSKIVRFPQSRGSVTLEIMSHPDDVIDVDPQVIATMKASLSGESFDNLFAREDQVTDALAIGRERKKLQEIFANESDVYEGFSSLDAVKSTRSKLKAHHVDQNLLKNYSFRKSAGQAIDEVDLYAHLISGGELRSKKTRIEKLKKLAPELGPKANAVTMVVSDHYLSESFGMFAVSKELVYLSSDLQKQFLTGEIQNSINEILQALYKGAV